MTNKELCDQLCEKFDAHDSNAEKRHKETMAKLDDLSIDLEESFDGLIQHIEEATKRISIVFGSLAAVYLIVLIYSLVGS